jgi:ribosome-associated protein
MTNGYIELNNFLKVKGIVSSGGEAKVVIRSERIKVNGAVETRVRKKLRVGDEVEFEGEKLVVESDVILN